MNSQFNLIVFGSTSALMQAIFQNHKAWFLEHIHELTLVQRSEEVPEVYGAFHPKLIQLDCSNPQEFGKALKEMAAEFSGKELPLNVFPTYGQFTFDYADKNPVFRFQENGFQVNLNSRLQILNAFREIKNVRFHLFGSLLGNFPYLGDYSNSMWYINQLPKNAEFRDLNLIIYNLGGLKTRFWDYNKRPDFGPFIHSTIPTEFIVEKGFKNPENKGVFTKYPSFISRIAIVS